MMENNEEVSQPEPDPNPGSPDQKIPANWLANFLPMFGGQIISLLGSSLVQFALVWYVTKLTGSAAVLATATTAALIPSILIGPFIGALVDRWNRKLVMILADLVVALATAVLALLFAFNLIQIWHIYLILFIRSLAGIFQGPAKTASISLMVPQEHLVRLGGVNQAVNGLTEIISPALGALLLELLPIQGVLAVDIVTAAIAILLMIFFVKVPQPKTVTGAQKVTPRSLLADVKSGFNYIVTWPGLLIVILIASSINLFLAPAGNLMPLLVTDFFNGGARELAWLQAAMGIGAILGGVLLGVWGGFKRKVVTVMIGILGVSLSVIGVGLVPQDGYITAIVLAGLTGLMLSFANGSLGPLLQTKVPSEKQGRVFTVLSSMSLGLMPIGLFLSAPIADRYGASVAYLIGGTVGLGIAIFGFLNRKVMTIDDQLPGGRQLEVTGQPGQATTID
ncbi:MAG: MFS transporter [Anaerolineaceae bacterium]|nr:MFS transporter [Anaerolineaceae bacterium]MDD4043067.1 MFS transporter [Anaerolineaceae bacterium]MDD4576941.1 MFS transporter [Anaerolineaceae bacterium]